MNNRYVGLCIVFRNNSYGGLLQSYATVLKMEELGLDYEIIDYRHPSSVSYYLKAITCTINKTTIYSKVRSLKRKYGEKKYPEYKKNDEVRNNKFDQFRSQRFHNFSKPIRDYSELQEYANRFTDIVVGSDQLWLPSGLATGFYNLMFAPDKCNKVSYASSFGVSTIPKNQIRKTKEYLERIQHLSVRELSGQKIIKELTGRNAEVILDPTMIITKEQWDHYIGDKKIYDDDYIFCMFLGNNPKQREEVEKLKNATGYKIIVLKHLDEYIPADEDFGDLAPYDIGPEEFVNLIRHAKYICTDSFHVCVFSIIYHKQFIAFDRFASGSNSRNSRLDTLFNNIGISRRFEKDIISEMQEPIDFEKVDSRINVFRSLSNRYIKDALNVDSVKQKSESIQNGHIICRDIDCTGCSLCETVCPRNAISVKLDIRGFYRPVVNNEKCINCNNCNRVCPINNQPEIYGPTEAFAFQNTNTVRNDSTSGGFFNAIASKIIDDGGIVCGAAFDEKMILRHVIVDSKSDLSPLQRSKYVQSSTVGIYKIIKQYLDNGRKVLFVGVGCQAAALRNYLSTNENLIIIDLVCYGVPSSGLFQDWIEYLDKKYCKVIDVRFRDKTYGYASPNVRVLFENGKYIESCRDSNMYTDLFFRHLSVRESCYNCRFKTVDRTSDITLGDLWSIGMFDKNKDDNIGTTVVFAHTEKGRLLCKEICQMKIDTDKIVSIDSRKMVECISPANGVNGFWKKYQEDGFESMIALYVRNTTKSKMKYTIKTVMNRAGISNKWYMSQKRRKLKSE